MSQRFPFPTKLNPVWWLKNSDQPCDEWGGFWRNPCHNLMWYVIGCTDRLFRRFGPPQDFAPSGWHKHLIIQMWPPFICPFVSYMGERWEWYAGWRYGGAFGARITRK